MSGQRRAETIEHAYFKCSNCEEEAGSTPGCEGCMEFIGEHPIFRRWQEQIGIFTEEWECRVDPVRGPLIEIPLADWNDYANTTTEDE